MVFVVAECGVNFRDLDEARRMICFAAQAGVDAVKFQVFKEKHVKGHPRFEELRHIILNEEALCELKYECDDAGVKFVATPFFVEAVDWLAPLVDMFKIRNADINKSSLVDAVLGTGKCVFASFSVSDIHFGRGCDSLRRAVFGGVRAKGLLVVPEYPPSEVVFPAYFGRDYFVSGFSSHYPNVVVPIAAVCRGAEVVEVHFMFDEEYYYKEQYTPIDSRVSLPLSDLRRFVDFCRRFERVEEKYGRFV